ncbi:MAG: MerC mercury resistance protein [Rhodobacteraceae bacterium HLUCCA12]|nr:MAG: MerC mercury resistance protein [Rhodobacteraceae bacterium HLUCCA12]
MKRLDGTAVGPDWIGLAASGLAFASCYGTLAVVMALSAAGIALNLDKGIWAAAIALFALLAVAAVVPGIRRHGNVGPAVLGAAGLGLIVWTLFGDYSLAVEIAGFAALVAGAAWDWRLRRARA